MAVSSLRAARLTRIVFSFRMQLFIKLLTGKFISVRDVAGSDTVFQLKKRIESSDGIPVDFQMLIFKGVELKNHDASLTAYGVQDVSNLVLILDARRLMTVLARVVKGKDIFIDHWRFSRRAPAVRFTTFALCRAKHWAARERGYSSQ